MLPKYQSILIATDLTPHASLVFRHAVMLARHNQATIHLVHVVPPIDATMRGYVSTVLGMDHLEKLEAQHREEALQHIEEQLTQFVEEELGDFPADRARFQGVDVRGGQPVDQILAAAKEHQVDVIVMGTHSKGILEHSMLGSVAEKVIYKSGIPTFVIPLPKH